MARRPSNQAGCRMTDYLAVSTPIIDRNRISLKCLSYIMEDGRINTTARCSFRLRVGSHGTDQVSNFWNWDGNKYHPTITPSVQCQTCGLHVVVTNGVESGRPSGPYTMK